MLHFIQLRLAENFLREAGEVSSGEEDLLVLEDVVQEVVAALRVEFAEDVVEQESCLTVHYDAGRGAHIAWRAHRNIRNYTYNQRPACMSELTIAMLKQVAVALQAHLS